MELQFRREYITACFYFIWLSTNARMFYINIEYRKSSAEIVDWLTKYFKQPNHSDLLQPYRWLFSSQFFSLLVRPSLSSVLAKNFNLISSQMSVINFFYSGYTRLFRGSSDRSSSWADLMSPSLRSEQVWRAATRDTETRHDEEEHKDQEEAEEERGERTDFVVRR